MLPGFWLGTANAATDDVTYFATVSVNERLVRYEMALPRPSDAFLSGRRANEQDAQSRNAEKANAIGSKIRVFADGSACNAAPGAMATPGPDGSDIRIALNYECRDRLKTLAVRYELFDVLGYGHRTIALIVWPGGTQQFTFQKDQPELQLDLITGTISTGRPDFLVVGLKQGLLGWELLLFLVCLLLPVSGAAHMLRVLAAFAAAQSLGLLASGMGWFVLPDRVTGAPTALSIVYVAGENLIGSEKSLRRRWLVACIFGFFYGIDLSAALTRIGLPQDGNIRSLLDYGIGIDTGLAIFLVLATPFLFWMRRNRWTTQGVTTISVLAIAIGFSLFVGRLFT